MTQQIKNSFYRLLRWTEHYTKTDMVYLTREGFWLSTAQVISALSSFILSIAFANLLPAETLGNYRYILSLVGILSITNIGGLNTAISQAVARGLEGSLKPALQTKIRWGTLGGIIALLISGYYYYLDNTQFALAMIIVAIFIPLMDSYALYDAYLQGKKKFRLSSRYFTLSVLVAGLTMFLALLTTDSLFVIMLAYFLPWTIMRLFFWYQLLRTNKLNKEIDPQTIPFGFHISTMGIIGTIANYFDRLIVFHFIGAIELAAYSIAIAPTEQLKGLLKNIGNLALPKFVEKNTNQVYDKIWQKTLKLCLIVSLVVILYILTAPFIFPLLFPKYAFAVAYSQVYALSLIATASVIPYTLLVATANKKTMYHYNLGSSLVQIFLIGLLAYFFGFWGIIWARVITRFINFGQLYYLLRQEFRS